MPSAMPRNSHCKWHMHRQLSPRILASTADACRLHEEAKPGRMDRAIREMKRLPAGEASGSQHVVLTLSNPARSHAWAIHSRQTLAGGGVCMEMHACMHALSLGAHRSQKTAECLSPARPRRQACPRTGLEGGWPPASPCCSVPQSADP